MTVNIYRSTDASAPTISGTAGSLVTLLDAVLVNGYGTQPAAGWSIQYTGTDKRVYKMGAGTPSFSLYINDAGPGAATGQEARASGFIAPTGLGTGTGQFPSSAQMTTTSGALVIRKSNTLDTTARGWTIVADTSTLYLFIETGDNLSGILSAYPFVFGNFFSYSSSDVNNCCIIGRNTENDNNCVWDPLSAVGGNADTPATVGMGQYVASSWTGVGGSVPFGKFVDSIMTGSGNSSAEGQTGTTGLNGASYFIGSNATPANFPYPNAADGAMWLSPIRICHNGSMRGYLKGLWAPLHNMPMNHDDVLTITSGNLSGKSFVMQNIPAYTATAQSTGQIAVEFSNTWS